MYISDENRRKARELVAQMTLEEKAYLRAGDKNWHTRALERLNICRAQLCDGPHGLRKERDENLPLSQENTVPATCFPAAVSTSCSFDRELLFEMGEAMAKECLEEDVNVILGPAANIKRSPLCGRNFEYISEDPFLAGEAAAALIDGIQSKNVGTSLKHFLANNQETARHSSNSVIDERTLREIYLSAFEKAVKKAQPYTVMCSYNKINGLYGSVQKRMLTDILKKEWGFKGFTVSDWGAMEDRAESVRAGLDLEMPGRTLDYDLDIVEAVKEGRLDEKYLDECIERVLAVVLQTKDNKKQRYDREKHDNLARRIARESAVLLRNENGVLPFSKKAKVAVIGEFFEKPRYQGAGSSLIAPYKLTSPMCEFKTEGINYTYARGYNLTDDKTDEELLNEAVKIAGASDVDVILAIVGLPDIYESEGYDRTHMSLPESHNRLVSELAKLGKTVVAVVLTGSAVELPWRNEVSGILLMNLAGQNVGGAVYDLIFGDFSPCGKLAETYPVKLSDTPSYKYFGGRSNIEYRESVFVGYRYFDTAEREVAYPFGFGLSYTQFEYSNMRISAKRIKDTDTLTVTATIKNTGKVAAKEIVELYIKAPESTIFRPVHELKGYAKVSLLPGEAKEITFELSKRAFAYYNVNISDWHVVSGEYVLELAASSRDIRLTESVFVESTQNADIPDYRKTAPMYYSLPKTGELCIPHEQYAALFEDKTVFEPKQIKPFNQNSTLREMLTDPVAKTLADKIIARRCHQRGITELPEEAYDAPLRSSMFPFRPMTRNALKGLILWANGNVEEGKKLIDDEEFVN